MNTLKNLKKAAELHYKYLVNQREKFKSDPFKYRQFSMLIDDLEEFTFFLYNSY